MAIPASKTELIESIAHRFEKLEEKLALIPAGAEDLRTMDAHAKGMSMSVGDLLSYLIGWNELVLKWLHQDDAGESIDFPEVGYQWNQLGFLAQKFYDDYENLTFEEKKERLVKAKDQILCTVAQRSNQELYAKPWYGKHTKGRMIQLNTASPYENARKRLHVWLKQHSNG